ncbi:hypothetical protein PFICI_14967 [Pestalotiopsis fici W106-1]|uniref:Uncharacterized protein n=1 Tax=Pestalotiopsis fici (strain W106-1 / CGMCC3.15140) TaxID=1229662 RepID=W3WJQ0_PESFW|nr:uncharacterized protein PFICI_14967 [Pestalotiopsis fici W106-1]ETS73362.1 hypothetical protein PFICI_14967 [Pestalotiopsis fici W106-1]
MYGISSESNNVMDYTISNGDTELLNAPGKRSQDVLPDYAAAIRRPVTLWSLHSGWTMYAFLLLGLGFAVGHHQYYMYLNGTPADEQVQKMRYGTVLAFLTKASLVAAVIAAFRQRIWATLVSTPLALKALDCLPAAPSDLLAAFNPDAIRSAKIAVFMAWFSWQVTFSCITDLSSPMIVILASQSLSVEPTIDVTTCPGAKVLNFNRETIEEFRKLDPVDNVPLLPASYWNSTRFSTTQPYWFDYYHAPFVRLEQLATIALYQDQPATGSNASSIACGHDWDCSFTVKFVAPGYKCDDIVTEGVFTKAAHDIRPPFDTSILLPLGRYSYYAVTHLGDYADQQMGDVFPGGIPKSEPPWPKHFGVFRTEPVLWIGYISVLTSSGRLPENRTAPGWNESFSPNIIRCENYETEYTVFFEYINELQKIRILDRKYIAPILNTTLTQDIANDGTRDTTVAIPESNYVFPQDENYGYVAAYHSFGCKHSGNIYKIIR